MSLYDVVSDGLYDAVLVCRGAKDPTPELSHVFTKVLATAGADESDVALAFQNWIAKSPFFPTPADILLECQTLKSQRERSTRKDLRPVADTWVPLTDEERARARAKMAEDGLAVRNEDGTYTINRTALIRFAGGKD